jgi:hypothetical protein
MVFCACAALLPRARTITIAALAFAFSLLIEGLKLVPALAPLRDNPFGALVLGHVFAWANLIAYLIGIATGALGDRLLQPGTRRESPLS